MGKDFMDYGLNRIEKQSVIKVDRKCISTLQILSKNSHNMGDKGCVASLDPQYWWDEIVDLFYGNVSYVMTDASVEMYRLVPANNSFNHYRQAVFTFHVEEMTFQTFEEMENWLVVNKFNNIALYSISKLVDMKELKQWYTINYTFITDEQETRNKKLEHIIENDWEDDLPF